MSRGKGLHHTYMKNFEKYEKINFFFDDYVYSLVSPIAISITLIRKKIQKNEKIKKKLWLPLLTGSHMSSFTSESG